MAQYSSPRLFNGQTAAKTLLEDFADAEDIDHLHGYWSSSRVEQPTANARGQNIDGFQSFILRFFQRSCVLTGLFTVSQGRVHAFRPS